MQNNLSGVHIAADALGSHLTFQTQNMDEALAEVSRVFNNHRLRVTGKSGNFSAQMYRFGFGPLSLNRIGYGAAVQVEPDQFEDYFTVHLSPGVKFLCGNKSIQTSPKVATVIDATLPFRMQIPEGCEQYVIRIDRAVMERCCARYIGHGLSDPIQFDPIMELDPDCAQPWCRVVEFLFASVNQESGMLSAPLFLAQYPDIVASTLLLCQPNNYTEELHRPALPIAPYYIKRAEDYMSARLETPISVGEIAEHIGVSIRTLHAGFQRFRGISPMAFLKSLRLQRAHSDLLEARQQQRSVTVTEVAMRWGFNHLGYFAADYKKEYGVSPSETLGQSSSAKTV